MFIWSVYNTSSTDENEYCCDCLWQELYPVNHLRNIAINNTLAQYILTVDVDFLPSQDLYDKIVTWLDTGFLQEGKVIYNLKTLFL